MCDIEMQILITNPRENYTTNKKGWNLKTMQLYQKSEYGFKCAMWLKHFAS